MINKKFKKSKTKILGIFGLNSTFSLCDQDLEACGW